ncbi:MAG: manganese efflux pump [Bacteroidales bacterium]|nr:manganese efflux pump [Bacteroidales bacterium]
MDSHLDLLTIIGIAFALSLDSFAVSVTNGIIIKKLQFFSALKIAFFFGAFQALMPLAGWAAGLTLKSYIQHLDHWIAFGLLLIIGGRMIFFSFQKEKSNGAVDCRNFSNLLMLSIATSIDALAVGLSFAMLDLNIFYPIAIIGGVTFVNCLIGIHIGKKIGHLLGNRLEIAGGAILILIGVKILVEHLMAGI